MKWVVNDGWILPMCGVLGSRVFQDRNREMDHASQLINQFFSSMFVFQCEMLIFSNDILYKKEYFSENRPPKILMVGMDK